MKKLMAGAMCLLLFACGGEVSIGYRSGSYSDSHSDLALTVRVDEELQNGFSARVGRDGATISLNSGQRIRITVDEPSTIAIEANGANIDLIASSSTVWEGIIGSPVATRVLFRFTSVNYPGDSILLAVDVRP